MRSWVGRVTVVPKPSVNDPQGLAVLGGLHNLGFAEVKGVRVGKHIQVRLQAETEQHAAAKLETMCDQLLANTLIESYTVHVEQERSGS